MKNRLTVIPVFALLVCFAGASAVAQSPEDPEALRRELAEERARLEEQMKRLDELERRLDAALAEEEAAIEAAPTTEGEKVVAGSDKIVPEQLQEEPNQTKDAHQVMTAAELEDDSSSRPGGRPVPSSSTRTTSGWCRTGSGRLRSR